jgi:transcription initiation factor TFIIB
VSKLVNIKKNQEEHQCCFDQHVIVNDDGLEVCMNCGVTFEQSFVESERRAFTVEEIQARCRTEPRWRSFGPRTVITNVNYDAKGHQLESKRQALYTRLSKIQGSFVNSLERNYWEAKPKLSFYTQRLKIPTQIGETAWKIYAAAARQKLTMGRSINEFVLASIYAAVRIHKYPCLLEEIADMSGSTFHSVHRTLSLLVQAVFPILKIKYDPVNMNSFIYRFGEELKISNDIQSQALGYLGKALKKGLKSVGKDPKGLAAAAIYMACKYMNHQKITQKEIADVARITEVTLRTRFKQIKTYL